MIRTKNWLAALAILTASTAAARAEDAESIEISAFYVGDVLAVPQGGIDRKVDYIDDIRLGAAIDAEALLGIAGGSAYVSGRAFNTSDFSKTHLGEFQKVSNIDTFPAARLYEAWYQQNFLEDRLSLRAGLYDLNAEFDVTPPSALFLNASQGIGTDFGQTGLNGPSIFPVTSLAARVAWRDPSGFTAMIAVLDGVPGDPAHPKRTAVKLSKSDGALVTGEVQYLWSGGKANLGAWTYTARFADLRTAASPLPTTDTGNAGVYGSLSGMIWEGDGPSLEAYVRAGAAAPAFNPVSVYVGAGLVATGALPFRPDDKVGIAVGTAHAGNPYRGLAVSSGRSPSHIERIVEVSYRAVIAPWLTVQPDFQAIFHPGFDAGVPTGLVAGLRFELSPLAFFR